MSIELVDVTKRYRLKGRTHTVLRNFNLSIPKGARLGLLGRNGAGKSTLLRLIGGVELPDRGQVIRSMRVSWPVGFAGFFQPNLSGLTNVKFCARIYNMDPCPIIDQVAAFSELGDFIHEPVKTYSSGMKARLAFALSMAIDFDCLLIDEVTAVGDARFRAKSEALLAERRKTAGMILVSHNLGQIVRMCDCVLTLYKFGPPSLSFDVKAAVERYRAATAPKTP
ncbi:MAG: ABC transporter ATP-binding protein [Alphaproteobacteria bacterium]